MRGDGAPEGHVDHRFHRENPPADPRYPLSFFMGLRDDEYFQTGQRCIPQLRKRRPEPEVFIHADDARTYALTQRDGVQVETQAGTMKGKVAIRVESPC